jgi:diacylglycerol kinase family enzyme
VARFANKNRRYFGDVVGTLFGLMRAIAVHKPHDLQIKIDGQKHFLKQCNHLMIIKNPYIASGLKLDLDLKNNDGKGYVLAICNKSKMALLKLLPAIYSGKIVSAKDVFIKPFTQIEVSSEKKVEIEFDGDPQGYLPIKAEISPCHLDLIGAANA